MYYDTWVNFNRAIVFGFSHKPVNEKNVQYVKKWFRGVRTKLVYTINVIF